jgi:PqqD family protein of HPr-rel-A system
LETAAEGSKRDSWLVTAAWRAARFRYEDGAVVFNERTWETQLLNEAATRILEELERRSRCAAELAQALTSSEGCSNLAEHQVLATLEEMAKLGLVARQHRPR